ncbi:hypothetical protein ACFOHW_20430 [Paenibacillus abyssi]
MTELPERFRELTETRDPIKKLKYVNAARDSLWETFGKGNKLTG